MPSPRTFVLVVAAGSGQRFGGDLPKQYQSLAGKPMLRHSLETFAAHPGIAGILVAIHPAQRDLYDAAAVGIAKLLPPIDGGAARQGSVLNGLERLAAERPDYVLIHDAARPLIDAGIISRTIEALAQYPAILVAVPVVDTIKRGAGDRVGDTVDRRDLWRAQTPQAFHFQAILDAHRKAAGGELTDDAAVAKILTGGWLGLAGAAALYIGWRWRGLAVSVIAAYAITAATVGGYLLYTSEVDRVVNEQVVTVEPENVPAPAAPDPRSDPYDSWFAGDAADLAAEPRENREADKYPALASIMKMPLRAAAPSLSSTRMQAGMPVP